MELHNPELRTRYKLENGECELTPLFLKTKGYLFSLARYRRENAAVETNHIWSIGRRPDLWSNLIDLHPSIHNWFHDNLIDGRVACLYAKWLKGGDDWNVEELNIAAGRNVVGWMEGLILCEPFATWRTLIVQHPEGKP